MPRTSRLLQEAYVRLRAASDPVEGAKCLNDIGHVLGMPHPAVIEDYSANRLLTVADGRALTTVLGWDPEPVEQWFSQKLHLVSPIAAVCRISTQPFAWDAAAVAETVGERRSRSIQWPLTPEQGYYGGITVPVHLPRGRTGSVSWYSRNSKLDVSARLSAHADVLLLAAHRFMDLVYKGRAESDSVAGGLTQLSERELECLTWAAVGRTDSEIGSMLHRSPTTARFHMDNAVRKLGARNRTQAVAIAVRSGLIHPPEDELPEGSRHCR
jgi:DNA-binding CsgD family transcriptional regulator